MLTAPGCCDDVTVTSHYHILAADDEKLVLDMERPGVGGGGGTLISVVDESLVSTSRAGGLGW